MQTTALINIILVMLLIGFISTKYVALIPRFNILYGHIPKLALVTTSQSTSIIVTVTQYHEVYAQALSKYLR